ncbi:MAG TPA: DUF1015 family protein [Spirochaetota bacterium]|nr:DUF1015 family protein [Spirochaetota bacterium]HOL57419.1 DUF1015 family protein [Spirochaetota bacterium]HPP03323.1 DUF1015 family protein [Spirochaetota bacterium]
MIKIKAFKAIKPAKNIAEMLISPPYDILTLNDCKNLVKNNPYSLIHITRSEVDLAPNINPYSEEVYLKAKENLDNFIKNGYLTPDNKEKIYVYREIKGSQRQIGFVVCNYVYDYVNGFIKKHENTRKDKEEDRINHLKYTKCQVEPVFLIYRKNHILNEILEMTELTEPYISVKSKDGVEHTLWDIENSHVINKIIKEFQGIDYLYIADGHHRIASSVNYALRMDENNSQKEFREYQYFMSVIFPEEQLTILPYNRAVVDIDGLSKDNFIKLVSQNFTVSSAKPNDGEYGFKPKEKGEIGMYVGGEWFLLRIKDNLFVKDDSIKSLDVSILQDYLLEPILNIKDPRTDKRIEFIGGVKGTEYLKEIVDSGRFKVSFSMYPTSMEELLRVSDCNLLMPPKSTWFEPKLISGLFLHLID